MNSYFVHALKEEDQLNTLAAMQRWGLKVLRIFISPVPANFKGSSSQFVSALEPDHMGAYEPQVLDLINSFMVKAQQYGVKLAIAMHDRYSLGCWACDGYQKALGMSCAPDDYKTCGPGVNDASKFYTDDAAISYFDQRLEYILNYRNLGALKLATDVNPLMGNKTWGELKEVVAMFEATLLSAPSSACVQNEAQGLDPEPWATNWHCGRAKVMKKFIKDPAPRDRQTQPKAILIGTGGGRTFEESTLLEHFQCEEIDVITLHDYEASSWEAVWNGLQNAKKLSLQYDKIRKVVHEEFGSKVRYYRPDYMFSVITAANLLGIPFMPWEYLTPPNINGKDYEFNDHQAAYPVLVYGVLVANRTTAAYDWPNLDLCQAPVAG
eukprot:Skav206625  [mRNA]  locus=scaffold2321:35473:40279:- [translate_table: standard]